MKDSTIIHRWERIHELVKQHELTLTHHGDRFQLTKRGGLNLGVFEKVGDVYFFLLGRQENSK